MDTHQGLSTDRFLAVISKDSISGFVLIFSAVIAIIIANTSFNTYYEMLIEVQAGFVFGDIELIKPFLLWVNDGLMAVFFFLVGLELKREFIEGELSETSNVVLPLIGAVGGMAFPALIYTFFNYDNPVTISGWAIPAATDIAFALGILALLGSRVPVSLKIFLTSLAIFDDIGAIIIIALFYTSNLSVLALSVSAACIIVLYIMNKKGITATSLYLMVGLVMWVSLLKSGVHATLSGVILAMFIPFHDKQSGESPAKILEENLHTLVALVILPIFAFCNSGISLEGFNMDKVLHPVTLGIALGLFLGNQVGIFALCFLAIKSGMAKLPDRCSWLSLYGVAMLCGVGFTMSLFIGSLAFQETGHNNLVDERLGIILGSLASGVMGYLVLRFSLAKDEQATKPETA